MTCRGNWIKPITLLQLHCPTTLPLLKLSQNERGTKLWPVTPLETQREIQYIKSTYTPALKLHYIVHDHLHTAK